MQARGSIAGSVLALVLSLMACSDVSASMLNIYKNDVLSTLAESAAKIKCGFTPTKCRHDPTCVPISYNKADLTKIRQAQINLDDLIPTLIDVEYWADKICASPHKSVGNIAVKKWSTDGPWLEANPRFGQLLLPGHQNDPYFQPVKLQSGKRGTLGEVADHILPRPKIGAASAGPAIGLAGMPRKAGPANPVMAAAGDVATPAADREAPVMQGWNQLESSPVAAAEAATVEAPALETAAPAPDEQFQSLQLTPEGTGPSAMAAEAATQAVSLEGQQQELAARQESLATETAALEDAVVRSDSLFTTRALGFLLIGFSMGMAVMYAGYDQVHVLVAKMNTPTPSAIAAARAAHALD